MVLTKLFCIFFVFLADFYCFMLKNACFSLYIRTDLKVLALRSVCGFGIYLCLCVDFCVCSVLFDELSTWAYVVTHKH